jgi:hypothetical protein
VLSQDFENVGQICLPQAALGTDIPLCKRVGVNQYRYWQCGRLLHLQWLCAIEHGDVNPPPPPRILAGNDLVLNMLGSWVYCHWWAETPIRNHSQRIPRPRIEMFIFLFD